MSNYTRLSAEAMRTISGVWLHHKPTRDVLEQYAKSAAMLPDIEEVHGGICDALGGEDNTALEEQLKRLREQGGVLDERHDRKYRGTWYFIEALIELADKPETAQSLIALRDRIHPNKLPQVNATWAAESGNAATVHADIDKDVRAELTALHTIEGRTLLDEVMAWIKAGEALGPIAAEKATIEHRIEHPEQVSSDGALHAARLAWIKTVRALESNLDIVKGLTATERSTVLGLLHQTAASADRYNASKRQGGGDEPKPPTPPNGPATG